MDTNYIVENMINAYFSEASENIQCVPDKIEPCVKALENKGYKVKYASPGHDNTKFDNDRNKDKVINGKLVSTGRIIFEKDYKFANTPQGWEWKVLEDKTKALYVKPFSYNEKKYHNPEEAFNKWQEFYIGSLRDWIKDLPMEGKSDKNPTPDEPFSAS